MIAVRSQPELAIVRPVGDVIAPVVVIVAPVTVATATIAVPIGTIEWTMIVVTRVVGSRPERAIV
jgi:hypothetical protein